MTLTARIRARRYSKGIERARTDYETSLDGTEREAIQLEELNRIWGWIRATVPHYRDTGPQDALPPAFLSVKEFAETVPITTRADVRRQVRAMTSVERAPDFWRTTGGSTAEPVQLPAWRSEILATRPDLWLGRGWYGIGPESPLFLIWGHSHLLGTGAGAWMRKWRVRIQDRLVGYHRFSAYDLRPERLRQAAKDLLEFRPEYVIGYSVALDLFARHNGDLARRLRGLGLKAVVGTSEAFPFPDSVVRLEEVFGCPVAMEYGTVETGLIGHTRPAGGYSIFWRTYLVEAHPHATGHRVLVTSLYPRSFPLVRYDIGDEIVLGHRAEGTGEGLDGFERVIGRCNDYLLLPDGAVIHSEAFSHALRSCTEIGAYQVVQDGNQVRVIYVADAELPPHRIAEIRGRLAHVHPGLARVRIERVSVLSRTVAGKTPMVIRKDTATGAARSLVTASEH